MTSFRLHPSWLNLLRLPLAVRGAGWKRNAWTVDLGWPWQLPREVQIDDSLLASGEYRDSETKLGIHWLGLSVERSF